MAFNIGEGIESRINDELGLTSPLSTEEEAPNEVVSSNRGGIRINAVLEEDDQGGEDESILTRGELAEELKRSGFGNKKKEESNPPPEGPILKRGEIQRALQEVG
ncbi:MAG: hypothetical protein QY312_02315 [Candidatus Dojkabacteria bacterium]|nr:MAG: hypothetical protein QY312_02315 [Candidatus Dojkabacteria bacterium]